MDSPTPAENINPLDAVEADWALIRVVEAAHSHFHMRPSLATAQALSAATDLWLVSNGGDAPDRTRVERELDAAEASRQELIAYGKYTMERLHAADDKIARAGSAALHGFARRLRSDYALDQSTPAALLNHIVSLAHRDADLDLDT